MLKKSLNGLKKSHRQSYKKFNDLVLSIEFQGSEYDTCLYFKFEKSIFLFILLYVDDMLIISKSMKLIGALKVKLNIVFDM